MKWNRDTGCRSGPSVIRLSVHILVLSNWPVMRSDYQGFFVRPVYLISWITFPAEHLF